MPNKGMSYSTESRFLPTFSSNYASSHHCNHRIFYHSRRLLALIVWPLEHHFRWLTCFLILKLLRRPSRSHIHPGFSHYELYLGSPNRWTCLIEGVVHRRCHHCRLYHCCYHLTNLNLEADLRCRDPACSKTLHLSSLQKNSDRRSLPCPH